MLYIDGKNDMEQNNIFNVRQMELKSSSLLCVKTHWHNSYSIPKYDRNRQLSNREMKWIKWSHTFGSINPRLVHADVAGN